MCVEARVNVVFLDQLLSTLFFLYIFFNLEEGTQECHGTHVEAEDILRKSVLSTTWVSGLNSVVQV